MKKLITILLLAISGFASAQTYHLNYPDIRIGNSNTGKIVLRGSNVQFPFLALGSTTDSVVTIDNGVFKKVPRSQFSGGGSGAVSSVFGRTGDVVALSADYNAFYPLLASTYNNPTWINTLAYSKITGVPAFITTESDPVWSGVASTYRTKTQNDGLYYPLTGNPSGFLTSYNETDPLFDTKFSGKTTTNLSEGTNLYFTQARVSSNTDVTANTAARHNAVTIGTANGLSLAGQALSMGLSSSGVTGALSGSDWNTFNSKQNQLVLTTLGTSGSASLIGNTLNIPNYATGGGAGSSALRVPVTLASGATVIPITWATYSATYGVSPTDLSLIESSATGDRQVFTNWYSDDNGVTYKFDVAPETGSRDFVVVISGGSTVTSGNVTSVTSANGDISVTNSTTTPVLTLNSGTGANQIVKRNGSGAIADLAPYLQSATAATTYEPIITTKNTAFNKNFGTVTNTVAEGNDSRINNGQTAFGWGNHASAGYLLSTTAASTYQTLANLSTSTTLGTSNVLYPSQNAVKTYVDSKPTPSLQQAAEVGNTINLNVAGIGENTFIAWDSGTERRLGLVKKAGFSPFVAFSNGDPFMIRESNTTDIYATNTFTNRFTIFNGGNVGIGISSDTGEKLQVDGTIKGLNFSGAGTGLTGTATSLTSGNAVKLSTPRAINGVNFDGSAPITIFDNTKQATLSGTGFVKASGTTITYDNTSYYPSSNPNGYTTNAGTVTNVTSANANISVATGSTTPVLTLNSTITSNTSGNAATATTASNSLNLTGYSASFGTITSTTPNYVLAETGGVLRKYSSEAVKAYLATTLQDVATVGSSISGSISVGGKITVGTAPSNPTDVVRLQDLPVSSSGTYVPTISNTTNVTSSSANQCFYTRQGNIVTVYGSASITPTSATNTRFHVSLPPALPATDFISDADLSGIVSGDQFQYGFAIGSPSLDVADLRALFTSTTGAYRVTFNFQYIIK